MKREKISIFETNSEPFIDSSERLLSNVCCKILKQVSKDAEFYGESREKLERSGEI